MQKRLLGIALTVLVSAQLGEAADKWLSVRSRNFLLVGNANESQIRRVGRTLEEFRAAFASLFPQARAESSIGTTVVVFKDDASFRPFKPVYQGKPVGVAGYFQAGSDVNFIALSAETQTPHVVYHELVHSFTKDAPAVPVWTGEGIAEFYGALELASNGKQMLIGRPIPEHVLTLNSAFLPLQTLFAVEPGSPYYNEKTKQGIFYAESWALVHYLMLGNERRRQPQFSKYLALIAAGNSVDDSFRGAFQTDYGQLEKELRDYVRNRITWPAIEVKLENKVDFDREMQATPLSEAQGQYYLGDLLLHTNRLEAAEAQLQKAIALDPKFPGCWASMGLLKVRQKKTEDALKFLDRAVQADSQNHMAHYYYAYMLEKAGKDQSREDRKSHFEVMRAHVKKAIELAPRFLEAYSLLGYVALVLRDDLPETEAALKTALSFAPGRHDLRLTLAEVMMLNKEAQAARVILTPMTNLPDGNAARIQAETLIENINAGLANEEAFREYEERRREAEEASLRDSSIAVDTAVDQPPKIQRTETKESPSDSTIEAAKPQLKRPPGLTIEGFLTQMDCTGGVTLHVRAGTTDVELHTDTPSQLEFMSYVSTISNSIGCGRVTPEIPVVVVYRRGADGRFLGEPIRVEFVDKK